MDVREIIEKLQNIDAKDLQNIDWGNLKNQILNKPALLINIIVAIVAISSCVYFLISDKKIIKRLGGQITLYENQLEAANSNKAIKKQYDSYLEGFPEQLSVDQIIEQVSQYALEHQIKILSYTPASKKDQEFITVSSFTLSVFAENFPGMLKFIETIENSPFALRVERWEGKYFFEKGASGGGRRGRRSRSNVNRELQKDEHVTEGLNAKIELTLINLNLKK